MKSITIVSYSFSGNNLLLGSSLADRLSAQHIIIKEKSKRNHFKILRDFIFPIEPKIEENYKDINTEVLVIFISPVWMGKVASPLRTVFKEYKNKLKNYIFLSISGGEKEGLANPNLKEELTSLLGCEPKRIINLQIVDILDDSSDMSKVLGYRLTSTDNEKLVEQAIEIIEKDL